MDVYRQIEQKIQALVAQRNQLREELERIKAEYGSCGAEIQQLRGLVEDMQKKNAAMAKERDEVRQQIESILSQLEALA